MTMKTTFEDRLLAELQGEIERRETDSSVPAARRHVFTGRRLALAAAACAVAGLAVVLVPGSPTETPAYAVERNGDGSVTLTLDDLGLSEHAQRELAERLRADGVHVDIQNLDRDHQCRRPRGEAVPGNFDLESALSGGSKSPEKAERVEREARDLASRLGAWKITLHRGDTLAFENYDSGSEYVFATNFYAVKGAIEPCVQVERSDRLEGVTTHSSKN
ncbi:hypothetical protein HLK59_30990 [Streptomyces sp. S3(2020)]|uniref:hypothetical protein n=1 Tax=Streptomyces sp. S3(2020) TaxID=2732044 RepID=UPI001487EA03|nr:hypothetical protein [Streptomyces sp. S3(2020)]NNN34709.1 hypothetical protein [Streptomyces sp. S3(2020)]